MSRARAARSHRRAGRTAKWTAASPCRDRRVRPAGATREGARAFRLGLEELGTTFSKLGQLLSSRPDLLPDVYIDELGHLVDSVPAVPFAEVEAVLLEDFGEDAFVSLDPEPLAAASIAQTHRGLLTTRARPRGAALDGSPGSSALRALRRGSSSRGSRTSSGWTFAASSISSRRHITRSSSEGSWSGSTRSSCRA